MQRERKEKSVRERVLESALEQASVRERVLEGGLTQAHLDIGTLREVSSGSKRAASTTR